MLAMSGELIPRQHVQKQAAFLVLSLRARLLALADAARARMVVSGRARGRGTRRDGARRLDEFADMPMHVSDPDWMQKLDDESSRPRSVRSALAK